MQAPVGFLAKLWSLVSFLPFFILLLLLGCAKGNPPSTMFIYHLAARLVMSKLQAQSFLRCIPIVLCRWKY
jgi:hypothetical protein